MQTRAKSIEKRVQTKELTSTNFAEITIKKLSTVISQKTTQKNQQDTKKIMRNTSYYHQRIKSKKKRGKNIKRAPQTPNKTHTTHLGRKVHRS